MKQKVFILLLFVFLVSMTGCEWIGTTFLGRPSKAELAQMAAAAEQHRRDSIAEVERAQLAALEMMRQMAADSLDHLTVVSTTADVPLQGERFHVVLGSFKVPENATRFLARLEQEGFKPQKFQLNGFECISAVSYRTRDEAYTELYRIMSYDYCPEDFWVYDIRENLHGAGN